MGNRESQYLWCDATNFRRYSATELMKPSPMPSDCGCRSVVRFLLTSRPCKTFRIRQDSKLRHLSVYNSRSTQKRKLVTSFSATF
jgi:hypothetical protein